MNENYGNIFFAYEYKLVIQQSSTNYVIHFQWIMSTYTRFELNILVQVHKNCSSVIICMRRTITFVPFFDVIIHYKYIYIYIRMYGLECGNIPLR